MRRKLVVVLTLFVSSLSSVFAADHAAVNTFASEHHGALPDVIPGEEWIVKVKAWPPIPRRGRPLVDLNKLSPEGQRRMLTQGVDRVVVVSNTNLKALILDAEYIVPNRLGHLAQVGSPQAASLQMPALTQVDAFRGWSEALPAGNDPTVVFVGTGIDGKSLNINVDCIHSRSFVSQDPNGCADIEAHETDTSGVAVAKGVNGSPVGIAPGRKVVSYKIFSVLDQNGNPEPPLIYYSTVEETAQALAALGDIPDPLVIANLSFAFGNVGEVFRNIFRALQDTVLLVAAAGNGTWNLDEIQNSPCDGDLVNVI